MSAETPASEPSPDSKCGDGMKWSAEKQECVPIESEAAGPSAASAEKGMFNAVKSVLKEALDEMRKEIMSEAKAMMKTELSKIQVEFASGLRKELGLSTDPTVTKSELQGAIRKAVLDLKVGGKRTPAGEIAKGADSEDKTPKPGDLFKSYGVS
jgi:hypothetical protein